MADKISEQEWLAIEASPFNENPTRVEAPHRKRTAYHVDWDQVGRGKSPSKPRHFLPVQTREFGIQDALEWAFGTECAQIERDELRVRSEVSATWLVAQIGQVGAQVDGGGHSLPADDADIIASFVSRLPVEYGGIAMADRIAHLARTGRAPDWMPDATPRIYPIETTTNRHGVFAKTADAKDLHGSEAFGSTPRRNRKGAIVYDPVLCCPVTIRPTSSQIAAAHRAYLDWWGALMWIARDLQQCGKLSKVVVTDEMPPMTPWK